MDHRYDVAHYGKTPPRSTALARQNVTPHSGYHWDGSDRRYFEGWYFRVTLPHNGQTIAFMYSIEDPKGNTPYSGGCAQILGPNEEYLCRTFPNVHRFWAWRDRLGLGHWGRIAPASPPGFLEPDTFTQQVPEGYQVMDCWHQGSLRNPAGQTASWQFRVESLDRWGDRHGIPQSTAGWFSQFQIFEPGWQVLTAHGQATGWVVWNGTRYDFVNTPFYAEKNWGGAFPQQWFWIQCNAFEQAPDLAVTSAGGIRQVLGWSQPAGLVGIHHNGTFYEFASTSTPVRWHIEPWGYWSVRAETAHHRVALTGTCDRPGTWVRVPSAQGMIMACRDTTQGNLTLTLWEKGNWEKGNWQEGNAGGDRPLVTARSAIAGLEVGGYPWKSPWMWSQQFSF